MNKNKLVAVIMIFLNFLILHMLPFLNNFRDWIGVSVSFSFLTFFFLVIVLLEN